MKVILFIALLTCCAWADQLSTEADTSARKSNYISFSPISLLVGAVNGNFEHLFGRHGAFIEGEYGLPLLAKTRVVSLAYRYHFSDNVLSGFCGPYVKVGYVSQKVDDTQNRASYEYALNYTAVGADIGRRGNLWKKFRLLYTLRVGLGYPFHAIDWQPYRPEKIGALWTSTFEKIILINAILDAEFTATFSF
jgi:hypothetical protein